MKKVFIDGSAGTTGLRIYERLGNREDIELLTLKEEERKDPEKRKAMMNQADVVFLCLPDPAAEEAVTFIENPDTVVIDTSTAHRTKEGWTYGFPELTGQAEKIQKAKRVANPGCHASGFIALVAPLVETGILDKNVLLTAYSLTGYSGGGKKMIAQYEEYPEKLLSAPRMYGLTQKHKHLPEMKKVCGLENEPVFCPVVSDYYAGMEVTVPVFASQVNGTREDIQNCYKNYYKEGLIHYEEEPSEGGFLSACKFEGRDDMEITVCGNEDRILLVSRFDNLGKGASGAAIQNMNYILGLPANTGLQTEE